MRSKMTLRSLLTPIVALSSLFLCSPAPVSAAAANPVAEMASFSLFDQINLSDLAKTDVKTAHGVPMSEPRFLSVQSCWVTPGSPEQMMTALHQWDPLKHKDLKVTLHFDVRPGAGVAEFSKLKSAPDNSDTRSLVEATTKMGSDLQISRDEAKRFQQGASGGTVPPNVVDFWANILSNRFRAVSSLAGRTRSPPTITRAITFHRDGNLPLTREPGQNSQAIFRLPRPHRAGPFGGKLARPLLGTGRRRWQGSAHARRFSFPTREVAAPTGRGRSLLCEWRLLRGAHAVSNVAGYGGRQGFHAGVAR